MSEPTGRTVLRDGVRLATLDYGGPGLSPLLLMHGAGMEQGSLAPLARLLQSRFRVVTFDFRGHGKTDPAPWTLDNAVQDAAAVAEAHGMGAPAVAGHSLGGMVAAAFAAEHRTCPAAINIDGHGHGRPEQFVGYDESEVQALLDKQQQKVAWLTRGPFAAVLRALLVAAGRRPATTPHTLRQVMHSVAALDLPALYRRVECPLLVFNATGPDERRLVRIIAGTRGLSLARAHREGIGRDLATVAADRPLLEIADVHAAHMLIRTHPQLVADRITDFFDRIEAAPPARR